MEHKGEIMNQLLNKPAIKNAVAVILTDVNRRIQWVNDDFTIITGYSFEEVVGKNPNLLQGKKSEPKAIERIRNGINGEKSFKAEILNYRKNGEEYLCKLVIHPIYNIDGELTNYIAFEIDGNYTDDRHLSLMQVRQKYRSSGLDNLKEIDLYAKLTLLFEKKQIYLDSNLKLGSIANQLNTSSKYLSQVVNNQTGENLIHFINRYRIDEAKRKIIDKNNQHLTTYGIAQTCGFKNKSTFYKVFKELTKMTPKDYIRMTKQ